MFDGRAAILGRPEAGQAGTSDEALMERVRHGDQQAYRTLVERHVDRMYALAHRLLHHPAEAEDVVQDAFLQVWSRRALWRPDGAKFRTWLYRVVVNGCIDRRRRPASQPIDEADGRADDRPDAVRLIHQRQARDRLRAALDRLLPQQRIALTLRYYEDMSNAESAVVMDLTVPAVEALLKRARQKLRELLKKSAGDCLNAFDDR